MKALALLLIVTAGLVGCVKSEAPVAGPAKVEVSGVSYKLSIENMMCTSCQAHVKETLEQQPGVASAEVDWQKGEAIIRMKAGTHFDEEAARIALDHDNYKLTKCEVAS
jgi:copper chaperone CopZ